MAEATNPQAGVPAAAPTVHNRLTAFLGQPEEQADAGDDQTPPETAPAEQEPAPVEAQPDGELTPEDIPDDQTPSEQPMAADVFEIVHNGAQVKLNRAEMIQHATQGFDYTRKTHALAERSKALDGAWQQAQEMHQIIPVLAQESGMVAMYESQLAPYANVNWPQIAMTNRDEYPVLRAQYDDLIQSYNKAVGRRDHAFQEYQAREKHVKAERMQQEITELPKYMPEWADPDRYISDSDEAMKWMAGQGVDLNRAKAKLDDAFSCAVLVKAMRYDKAMKARGEKSKLLQTVPPVARPGVHPSREAVRSDRSTELAAKFKRSGDIKDGAALLATRLKL